MADLHWSLLVRLLCLLSLRTHANGDGHNVDDHRVRCVGSGPSEVELLKVNGQEYSIPNKLTWRDQVYCGDKPEFTVVIEGINTAVEGQTFINNLVMQCQQMNTKYKFVQPYFQNKDNNAYQYVYKVADVLYGRFWNLGDRIVYNDIWEEAGGGFDLRSWNRRNCRYLFDPNELDIDTSVDSKIY